MLATVKQIQQNLRDSLEQSIAVSGSLSSAVIAIIGVFVLLLFAQAIDRLVRWVIRSLVPWIVDRFGSTKGAQWLEAVQKRMVARRGAHIISVLIVYWAIPLALDDFPDAIVLVRNLLEGYVVIVTVMAINSLLRASEDVLLDDDLPSGVSLRFASQGAQVVVWVVGSILAISVIFDTSVTVLLSGMAGMTAVLLLVFRIYLQQYLRQHPDLRADMTLIVNQLPPSAEGLPIQIVVFCKEQEAAEFKQVQADIFDHIIAILPEFGLKAFQGPTSDRYLRD